ncbi:MAG: Hsp33 family molecular chaperone HslO [Geobacteraceae bacterium]|nr:Hsp33 family molecular chaperone HslO [Geobacteraceae bacterium]
MNDHYIRAMSQSGAIRILVCDVTALSAEICSMQKASATVSIALGRALAAGALMGGLLKGTQRVALKYEGNGPMKKLIVEADAGGAVRGSVGNPEAEAEPVNGKWNVAGILGNAGFLTVAKDPGTGAEPYRGTVQLHSSEIGNDLALYLTESEQTPSAVGLGASLDSDGDIAICGGFLVQALPKAEDVEIDALMERIAALAPISEILAEGGTEGLLAALVGDMPSNRLETRELYFKCGCTRSKVEQALYLLGTAGLKSIIDNEGVAEVRCEFCRKGYSFDREELKRFEMLSALPEEPVQ